MTFLSSAEDGASVTRPAPKTSLIERDQIGDDTFVRLDILARLAFPDGSVGITSLRRESKKGRLTVWRVAGKDMSTLREIRKMLDLCLVKRDQSASGSNRPAPTGNPSGTSATADAESALAAAKQIANRLRSGLPSTLPPSENRRQRRGTVIPLKS